MPIPFDIGKTYTFNTLAPSILGATIENAKLVSIVDYDNVVKYENFIIAKYNNILSQLPNGTPTKPSLSIYYIFEKPSGDREVFSQYWVDEGTIVELQLVNLNVTITDVSIDKIALIRDLLLSAEISTFSIEQI